MRVPGSLKRRDFIGASLGLFASLAFAQAWPTRPLHLVVPTGPGSVPDVRARWLAERLGVRLGQAVVVENKPGAGGNLAMEAVARSEPDGHTIVMMHVALMVFNPLLYERLGYDAQRDFVALTRVGVGPLLLLVSPQSSLTTLPALLEQARRQPGVLNHASQGVGTPPHLAAELLLQEARIRSVHVPYTNPMQPIADLLGGHVDWLFEGTPVALPLVRNGRLRALAVTAPQRLAELPDVPTMAELGLPRVLFEGWTGLALPAATPAAVVDRLYREIAMLLKSEESRQWFGAVGNVPGGETPRETAELVQADLARWRPIIKAAGLQLRP